MGNYNGGSFSVDSEVQIQDGSAATPKYFGFPGLVELGAGELIVSMMRSTDEQSTRDGNIVGQKSIDGGASWGGLFTIAGNANDLRDSEIMMTSAGTLICSFAEVTSPYADADIRARVVRSTDGGTSWGSLISVPSPMDWEFPTAKAVELSSGRLLLPIYGEGTGDTLSNAQVCYSDDDGLTWAYLATIVDGDSWGRNAYEPYMTVDPANDHLWCGIRSDDSPTGEYLVESDDGGVTWTSPVRICNGSGRPAIYFTKQRILVLDYRDTDALSVHGIRYSADYGETWTSPERVNSGALMSYGSWQSLADGRLGFVWAVEQSSVRGDVVYQAMSPPQEISRSDQAIYRSSRAAALSMGGATSLSVGGVGV